jgi:hypothetical protein
VTLIVKVPALAKTFSHIHGFRVVTQVSMTFPWASRSSKTTLAIWPSGSLEPEASKVIGRPT